MELITSKLIPVPHGFPTREGGVSAGAWRSLNAGLNTGDDRAHVEQNLKLLAAAATVSDTSLFTVSQVHGDVVIEVLGSEGGHGVPPPIAEADGLWTQRPDTAVGIKTADCLPVLLCDPRGKRVAAVHAGWRGTIARIVERALEQLIAAGSRPQDIVAAVGPAIQSCCYEVGADLGDRFEREFGPSVVVPAVKPHLKLKQAVKLSLLKVGVPEAQIELLSECTSCDPRFYSHRRDQGVTGRHLSFIAHRF